MKDLFYLDAVNEALTEEMARDDKIFIIARLEGHYSNTPVSSPRLRLYGPEAKSQFSNIPTFHLVQSFLTI